MYAQFRYLDGPRAGEVRAVGNDFATIGRHPNSDVGFDPDKDVQVSVRHAAVFKQGGGFLVRDLGSTNGTFLNGKRVRGDRPLEVGDVLQFGSSGPTVEFTTVAALPAPARPEAPAPTPKPRAEIFGPRTRTTERIRVEVRKQTRPWRWVAVAALVIAVAAGSGAAWQTYRLRQELEQQRTGLLSRVDDLLARFGSARGAVAGVDSALERARRDIGQLRSTIAADQLTAARLDTLAQALAARASQHQPVLAAASLDPAAASQPSGAAVAVLVGELPGGRLLSGTAFGVAATGDTIWLATARHLIRDSLGLPAVRLAVIFNGSGQAFRAAVARVSDSADAALLVAVIRGGGPTVAGLADAAAAGDPVAMIGYPFGLDSLGDWRRVGVKATTAVGTVVESGADRLALDGYGTAGSSGSPVISAAGRVVGLVSGRSTGADARLIAVPIAAVRRLLPSVP